MNAVDHIKAAQQSGLVDKEGEPLAIEWAPPLTPAEINSVEQRVGQRLPEEWRTVLAFCSAIEGWREDIDFTGGKMAFEYSEVFPHGFRLLTMAVAIFGFWMSRPTQRSLRPFSLHVTMLL